MAESLCEFVEFPGRRVSCLHCLRSITVVSLMQAASIRRQCTVKTRTTEAVSLGEKPYNCQDTVDLSNLKSPVRVEPGLGTGIVMPGGGPYLKSAWVSIRMIRKHGCELPIELWLLPWETITDNERKVFSFYNVTVRTAEAGYCLDERIDAKRWKRKVWLAGWQLKVQAVLQSEFRSVLYFDADCYPINNNAIPQLMGTTNSFLGDIFESGMLLPDHSLKAFRVEGDMSPVDSGAFFVTKETAWCEAVGALNGPAHVRSMYGDWLWGDKDTWQIAMKLTNTPFRTLSPGVSLPEMLGIEHSIGLIHRTCCKFTDASLENTPQRKAEIPLPGDEQVKPFLKCWPLLEVHGKRDFEMSQGVIELDEYRLDQLPPQRTVIDAGGNIGSFSRLVKQKWSNAKVIAIEPGFRNCELFERNTGFKPIRAALGDDESALVWLIDDDDDQCYRTERKDGGNVPVRKLSKIIAEAKWGSVSLLKLDIEGDEEFVFNDLCRSGAIHLVKRIVGEWHGAKRMFAIIEQLRQTHHITAYFHQWDHGYFEAVIA